MNEVYILEYPEDTSFISGILKFFTGMKYAHTAMIINNYFCELNPLTKKENEGDYHIREFESLGKLIQKQKCHAFMVPVEFHDKQIKKMYNFWFNKRYEKYGYIKLSLLPFIKIFFKFARIYYIKKGKPLPLECMIWEKDACSNAVDKCLKAGGYDILPDFPESITYPGLFTARLKGHRIY